VIQKLANATIINYISGHKCSAYTFKFIAKELRSWLSNFGVKAAYIEPRRRVFGRMAFAKVLTASLGTISLMEKSSITLKKL
jgi:hypothetical protein